MKKNLLLFVVVSFFVIIPNNVNGQSKKYVVGIHSGYSFFMSGESYESRRYDSEYKAETKLGFHGGFNLQYYFSARWAIQVEMDYQRKTHHTEYTDFVSPENNYSRVDNLSFTVYYLNLIYRITNKKDNFSFYFSAGIGIEDINPFVLYSKIGNGIRYSFSPHTSLHLGVSFLPVPFIYRNPAALRLFPFDITYFSLDVGLEYRF